MATTAPFSRRGKGSRGHGFANAGQRTCFLHGQSGHDHRVWDQPEFADLLRRAILWSVGDEVRAKLIKLDLPEPRLIDVRLPGYREKQLVTKLPEPLPPAESMKLAQVPTGFELSLFASEPDIVNPIFISWDEKGRAWVIETIDYPNNLQADNLGHDRITICEDTDGDGKADKFTRFAEKLSIPSTLAFVQGGSRLHQRLGGPFPEGYRWRRQGGHPHPALQGTPHGGHPCGRFELPYGRGQLDLRHHRVLGNRMEPLETGSSISPRHSSASKSTFRKNSHAGADGTLQEYVTLEVLQNTTNNTWGLGFTNDFDIMGSTANGNPSWYFTFAQRHLRKRRHSSSRALREPMTIRFFNPSSMDIRQVDQFDKLHVGRGSCDSILAAASRKNTGTRSHSSAALPGSW